MTQNLFTKIFSYYITTFFCVITFSIVAFSAAPQKDFYQIKVYHLKSDEQVQQVDKYLKTAYLPALHRAGISKIGVFKPIANDTAHRKQVYVFIPLHSVDEWLMLHDKLEKDVVYNTSEKNFVEAASDNPPYERIESILLEAFPMHPKFNTSSSLKAAKTERVYELRSYESPTESLYEKKVKMFNEGDEIGLFKRLNFNAVFYAKVISGCRMPNLIYMTSFESVEDRDAHWKSFGEDPYWKKISADPQYKNEVSVSHIDSILMHATDYSDI